MTRKPSYEELAERVKTLEKELERRPRREHGEAEEQLKDIFDMSLDMICIADIQTATFLKVNPAFTATLGFAEEELLGRPFLDFVHPEDLERTVHVIEDSLRKGKKVVNFRNRYRSAEGHYRWLNWVSHPQPEKGITVAVAHDITDEVRSKEALEESERRLRMLADFTHSWEYWLGPDKGLIYMSPSCMNYTGYSRDEFMRDSGLILNLIHPEDRDRFSAHLRQEDEATRVTDLEFRIRDRTGMERWLLHTCRPIFDESGRFLGHRASNREITDQKRAEIQNSALTESLKQASSLLRSVLDAIPDVIGVQDPQHRIIRYNEAGYRFLGLSPEESHGKKCYELIGHSAPCDICATSEVYRTKQAAMVEKYFPEIDRWLDVRAYPILDENGKLCQVIEHLRDITERKRVEEELARTTREWQTTFDATNDAIWILSPDHCILRCNETSERLFHRPRGDLVGRHCWEIVHGTTHPIPECPMLRSRHSLRREVMEFKIGERWFQITVDPILDASGGFTGGVHFMTDITSRKRAEEERAKLQSQLLQAQKMESVGRLAGGVAHDFNNMLQAILGHTELALAKVDPSQPLFPDLQEIRKAAERSATLVRQLLAFARKQTISPKVLDLNETVKGMLKMLRRLIGEDLDLAWMPGQGLRPVKVDPSQIDQILANLAVNARDAVTGVGKLTIETNNVILDEACAAEHPGVVPGEYVLLAVSDNGVGMDKDVLKHLFEPFFTTKGVDKGTGLGLATVYGIVKQNNGFVSVYSEPGRGTTVKIFLPSYTGKIEERNGKEAIAQLPGGRETILLVEDDPGLLDMIRTLIERQGYTVLAANTPTEALSLAEKHLNEIHLVLTDVVMPEMNGRVLLEKLQSIRPGLKCLYMSGYTANVVAHQGVLDSGVQLIQKPFSAKALAEKVREILDEG